MVHTETNSYGLMKIKANYGKAEFESRKVKDKSHVHKRVRERLDVPICVEPGCVRRAICVGRDAKTGAMIPNQLCVTHWSIHYDMEHPIEGRQNTRVTKAGIVVTRTKKGAVGQAVNEYISKVGIDNTNFDEMRDVVLAIKADSKFNRNHYNWYRNNWKKINKEG